MKTKKKTSKAKKQSKKFKKLFKAYGGSAKTGSLTRAMYESCF